ncbi:MAG: translation initiation factor [Muribaculaceae bacterium]|nr:translation initiation factor [Muribaculaceae bacterium]
MDWKDMLSQLRDDLPQVEDSAAEAADETKAEKPGLKKGTIRIVVEKKGRKGKTATIAEGFTCDDDELEEVASKAKRHLGVGGSARGGEILMQGECRERFAAFLRTLGYTVK